MDRPAIRSEPRSGDIERQRAFGGREVRASWSAAEGALTLRAQRVTLTVLRLKVVLGLVPHNYGIAPDYLA